MKFPLTILFFLLTKILFSQQNLVQNPSFEECYKCPENVSIYLNEHLDYKKHYDKPDDLKFWTQPTEGTYHYFNNCSTTFNLSTPSNICGYQIPRTGNSYIGLILLGPPHLTEYRTYIQSELNAPLIKGVNYLVRLYCSNPVDRKNIFLENTLGIYFSVEKIQGVDSRYLPYVPQISNLTDTIKDEEIWYSVCGIYKADGGEKYITIGNFKKPEKISMNNFHDYCSYMYIDDILVEPVNDRSLNYCNVDSSMISVPFNKIVDCNDSLYKYYINNIKVGSLYELQNVSFPLDSTNLNKESFSELKTLIDFLIKNEKISIEIYSHSNKLKSEETSYELTTRRAQVVAEYLINNGVPANRISYKGYGATLPIVENDTKEGIIKNNRIEFRIIKK